MFLKMKPTAKQMYGPVLLLQHWSWSRLPVGRPIPNEAPDWGEPDVFHCPAYAKKWYGFHHYQDRTHGATVGIRTVRSELQSLPEPLVEWTPYDQLYEEFLLPGSVTDEQEREMWFYRGPLIHFWIVEHHYPDRVLRQFGRATLIPADPSLPSYTHRDLHR